MSLPANNLQLQKSRTDEDVASLSNVHNLNADTIVAYVNSIKAYVEELQFTSTLSQTEFNSLLESAKSSVTISVSMNDNDFIEFNGFRLTRIGVPANSSAGVEFVITDTDSVRNTNFRNAIIVVRTFSGQTVYPIVSGTLTSASIIFGSTLDVAQTIVDTSIDPNNKRLFIL